MIMRLTLYLAVFVILKGLGSCQCPSQVPPPSGVARHYNGQCYLFVDHEVTWAAAQRDCHAKGGYLVEVADQATQTFLVTSLRALRWAHHGVWIGATDHDKEGTWVWDTGRAVSYTHWAPGQEGRHGGWFWGRELPPNSLEDCAQIRLSDQGRWHDYPCDLFAYKYSYICQLAPLSSTTSTTTTATTTPQPTTSTTTTATTTPQPTTTATTTPQPTSSTTPRTTTSTPPPPPTTTTRKITISTTTPTTTTTTSTPATSTTPPTTTTTTTLEPTTNTVTTTTHTAPQPTTTTKTWTTKTSSPSPRPTTTATTTSTSSASPSTIKKPDKVTPSTSTATPYPKTTTTATTTTTITTTTETSTATPVITRRVRLDTTQHTASLATSTPSHTPLQSHTTLRPALTSHSIMTSVAPGGAMSQAGYSQAQHDASTGMNTGTMVGIIVGAIASVVVVCLVVVIIYRSRDQLHRQLYPEHDVAFENYSYGSAVVFTKHQDHAVLCKHEYPESTS